MREERLRLSRSMARVSAELAEIRGRLIALETRLEGVIMQYSLFERRLDQITNTMLEDIDA